MHKNEILFWRNFVEPQVGDLIVAGAEFCEDNTWSLYTGGLIMHPNLRRVTFLLLQKTEYADRFLTHRGYMETFTRIAHDTILIRKKTIFYACEYSQCTTRA